jgi:FHS family glucose/mannose:H+ symporter-like MFS transporter
MSPIRAKEPPFGLLCFGFVVCGIVTVLPGPLLPLLAARWGLRDVQSGAFFAAEFAASTIAAILSPRRMRWSLPRGYALMTAGVLMLVVAGRAISPNVGNDLALGAFALIGFGIGLSVTATNLVVGGGAPEARARRLSLVNLWWGIGAVACPWLVAAAEHADDLRLGLALVSLGAFIMFIGLLRLREEPRPPALPSTLASDLWVLVYFAVLLFLYVGVENTVGGWIATYAHRFTGMTLAHASLMVSVYWLALLGGRGLGSLTLKKFPERGVMVFGLGFALAAVAMLIEPRSTLAVVAAVAAAGFGFGPFFPLGVSRMLARVMDHRNTGWVFATCASGGAVLPWLTGLVSTRTGSLRLGFGVPVAALATILLMALGENVLLGEPDVVQAPQQEA